MTNRAVLWQGWALLITVMALGALGTQSLDTWLTLTVAGLAMGGIIFLTASGLTLIFGMMDVLHFGHGLFISIGAYVATSVFAGAQETRITGGSDLLLMLLVLFAAVVVTGLIGLMFERIIVRPVYGDHLKQILVTMGGLIVGEEMLKAIWGPDEIALQQPRSLTGALVVGDAIFEKYRLLACAVGLIAYALLWLALNRTKIGLVIRAGVMDREMVEALGYKVRRLFVGVFVMGSGLAGIGGVMWGLFQQSVTTQLGPQLNVLIFIVIVIGGLGSTTGALLGAMLVGLVANYIGFLAPKMALVTNIAVMVAILLWRPRGLVPVN